MFRKWITSGITKGNLTSFKVSSRTLTRYFDRFLSKAPLINKLKKQKEIYLTIDGSYFKRWGCVLVYKTDNQIIFWDFNLRENYSSYCLNLSQIKELGYLIKGITSDRLPSLVAAVKTVLPPEIPHQYCLVHLQRFCQSFLTQKPKTQAGQDLLELSRFLNSIKTHYEARIWLQWLTRLTQRYQNLVKERTYLKDEHNQVTWWYTHKNLRRVFRTLNTSKDNLFLYLDFPGLPKDINGLEAEFSHLKRKVSLHRGLKRRRKVNLVKWYFYFRSKRK